MNSLTITIVMQGPDLEKHLDDIIFAGIAKDLSYREVFIKGLQKVKEEEGHDDGREQRSRI